MDQVYVALVEEAIDAAQVTRRVQDSALGGVVVFLGDVRRLTEDVETSHLEYEAYPEMALKTMRSICEDAAAEFSAKVAIVHRVGKLLPGETSVVCAAACVHRADAFDCCRRLIDRLKNEVAIWKKEVGPDGEEWVAPHP